MRRATLVSAAAAVAIDFSAGPAAAQRIELGAGTEIAGAIGSVNVGEQGGTTSDGRSDLVGRRLGLVAVAGVARGPWRFGAEAGLSIGGLSLARIEGYYSSEGRRGGSGVVSLGAAARYEHPTEGSWKPVGVVRLGWQRLFASSDVGGALVDGVVAGLAAGASCDLSPASPGGGSVSVLAGMRLFRVLSVSLADHTDGFVTPSSPAMYLAPSLGARYQHRF